MKVMKSMKAVKATKATKATASPSAMKATKAKAMKTMKSAPAMKSGCRPKNVANKVLNRPAATRGWEIHTLWRNSGDAKGQKYYYYVSPSGKKYPSKARAGPEGFNG